MVREGWILVMEGFIDKGGVDPGNGGVYGKGGVDPGNGGVYDKGRVRDFNLHPESISPTATIKVYIKKIIWPPSPEYFFKLL